jgi:signal transduction histidine kinase/ActR/RegA family two-component response regulator
MESLEFYRLMRHQNAILEKKVEERTQALAESERQMQQVLKLQAIGTLAGGIAHDFNNILFPIIGYTELTLDDVAEDSQSRKNLEEILKAANRAKELVQQILTFSRQNGRERKAIKVQVIVNEALKLLRASIPKTIDITAAMDDGCNAIMGDPTQIHQVIMNLCTNAYQAMQENGGILEVGLDEVDIGYAEMIKRIGIKMGRHVHLWVKDNGIGMDAAVMARIFEPYYTTKEPGKGTGLGLSVIHGIVKSHSGFIEVESTPGKGSRFHIYLPTLEDAAEESEKQAGAPETGGKGHILLVDDEETIVAMARQMLEKFGYEVTAFSSSMEALDAFKREPGRFDLLITDMTMPQLTGDQLAKQLLDIAPALPIILCTGYNEMITEDKALKLGIKKFVMKPIVRDEFAAAIRSVLGSSPPATPPPSGKPA